MSAKSATSPVTEPRMIGYARVSTADQKLDMQLDALKASGVDAVYQDVASGAVGNRAGLKKALDSLHSGDTLVVWRLDRIGRTVVQLSSMLEDFRVRGIKFKSLTENLDTSSTLGRAVFHIVGALAEMEREALVDRIKSGIVAAKRRGERTGRKPVMNPERVALALKLLDGEGQSYRAVARQLGISQSALYLHVGKARVQGSAARKKPSKAQIKLNRNQSVDKI